MNAVRSCASCDEVTCAMHLSIAPPPAERTAWLLDDVSPETASLASALIQPGDQFLAPGIWRGFPDRYDWPAAASLPAIPETIRRHLAMRRVAKASGGIRQRTYLEHDRAIARRLARSIDFRARHLVLAQAWLPWLDEAGALGGRSFDVVMSRYPFGEIHRLLDAAAAEIGASASIADFRAEPHLVEREAKLLDRARRIITPHHGIAALFPDQAMLLTWHRPNPTPHRPGDRIAFLGPTIARQRPDLVRAAATAIDEPLIVSGPILEPLWDGIAIERRQMGPDWLDGIGTILHPAVLTNEPRRLLEAVASGVKVYATPTCGLTAADYLPFEAFGAA